MSSLRQEAVRWIGAALLIAVLIAVAVALFLPEADLLALRYSVL